MYELRRLYFMTVFCSTIWLNRYQGEPFCLLVKSSNENINSFLSNTNKITFSHNYVRVTKCLTCFLTVLVFFKAIFSHSEVNMISRLDPFVCWWLIHKLFNLCPECIYWDETSVFQVLQQVTCIDYHYI
mgnify:CR=1 FL=1